MDDVVPSLLEMIEKDFAEDVAKSEILKSALFKLKNKIATYTDVHHFAVEIGQILSKSFNSNITIETLPDGKMYFNIADRILNPTLQKNYDLISKFATNVQTELNNLAGFSLKAQSPPLNQDKIDGLVNRISSADNFVDIQWILNEPIVTFSQSIVDDFLKSNVEFQAKAGLKPHINRTIVGRACDWCRNLSGSYDYPDVPDDVYHRHERCRCTVDYKPGDGRKQNVWSKRWKDSKENDRIELRKQLNIDIRDNNRLSDSKDYKKYMGILGIEKMPISLAKFQDLKYNSPEKYDQLLDKVFVQQKLNSGEWIDKINIEKQARHIQSTAPDGKSYFYDSINLDNLYTKYKDTGFMEKNRFGSRTNNKKVDLFEDIPLGIDFYTGNKINAMTIKYSKTGIHLIPTYYERSDS